MSLKSIGRRSFLKRAGITVLTATDAVGVVESHALQGTANSSQGTDTEEVKKEVLKVEGEMTAASAARDIDTLARIFADDMVWTARGDVLDKAQVLADFKSENDKLSNVNHYDLRLHVYGTTVILTGRSKSIVRYKGKISRGPRLYTQVYIKLDGRWQLASHQVTDVQT